VSRTPINKLSKIKKTNIEVKRTNIFFKKPSNQPHSTMPTIILDRIPLPNLKIYTSVSVLLVSFCVYFAINSTKDPDWRLLINSTSVDSFAGSKLMDDEILIKLSHNDIQSELDEVNVIHRNNYVNILLDQARLNGNQTRSLGGQLKDVMDFMFQEPVCIWVSFFLNKNIYLDHTESN